MFTFTQSLTTQSLTTQSAALTRLTTFIVLLVNHMSGIQIPHFIIQYDFKTNKIQASFSPLDSLTGLKLLEAGLTKDSLVTLSALLIPLQVNTLEIINRMLTNFTCVLSIYGIVYCFI